jgi:hypothetical protein
MATFCTLLNVELEAKEEATKQKEAPKQSIFLNELHTQVHLGTEGGMAESDY